MAQENFDEEFDQLHTKLRALEKRIQEPEQPQTIVLARSDGKFKVHLAVVGLDLVATPMLPDEKTGEWNTRAGQSSNVARWSFGPGGTLIRVG